MTRPDGNYSVRLGPKKRADVELGANGDRGRLIGCESREKEKKRNQSKELQTNVSQTNAATTAGRAEGSGPEQYSKFGRKTHFNPCLFTAGLVPPALQLWTYRCQMSIRILSSLQAASFSFNLRTPATCRLGLAALCFVLASAELNELTAFCHNFGIFS